MIVCLRIIGIYIIIYLIEIVEYWINHVNKQRIIEVQIDAPVHIMYIKLKKSYNYIRVTNF